MMDFYLILQDVMREKELTIPEVARLSGLSDSTVRSIISRKSKTAALEVAAKISRGLDVSLERLNGENEVTENRKEAPKYAPDTIEVAEAYQKKELTIKNVVRKVLDLRELNEAPRVAYIKMKVYNEPAAAGIGDYLSDYSDTSFELEEFPEDEIPCKASFGIRISGDSMEPTIKNGSVVWVKEQAAIENGEIGIFVLNGESYCKKLYINYENKKIELVSLNPKYKNITVYEDDNLRTIGRVLL